jgi:FtsZ-interacting cell division protein ZipA
VSSLQLGLVVAGVLLVVGVILFNRWQERRIRQRIDAAFASGRDKPQASDARVEPTLRGAAESRAAAAATPTSTPTAVDATAAVPGTEVLHDPDWRPPMDSVVGPHGVLGDAPVAADAEAEADEPVEGPATPRPRGAASAATTVAAPDTDIETIVMVQPTRPATAGALSAGLHARIGKPVRWYGRREPRGPWQRLVTDSRGEYGEFAACMLLADRNGPATASQIETFQKLVGDVAASLPGAFTASPLGEEAQRAEALDRLCAELDMQIGLTVRKTPPATIAGTRLRGVAEAAGFRLAPTGRFEWVQDDTGAVLFTLQNVTDEAFTADSLRAGATSGVVFLLDVPRVVDPPRAFDQMKLAAKRMAQTVGGELVDDNGRLLNDAGLAAIREQVAGGDAALRRYNIEPGSPRALKLFAA